MEFHFISLRSGGAATIIDVKDKPRFICFRDRKHATKYATYLCEHKSKFGTWPTVDLSASFIKVRLLDNHIETTPYDYMNLLDIVHKDRDDLDNMSVMTGINFFYCHLFEYEDLLSLRIRGQEIDGYVNDILYRENMDDGLKNL